MTDALLLAQVATISDSATVTVSVLVVLLSLAGAVGALFWRVSRLERDHDALDGKVDGVDGRAQQDRTKLEVALSTLGRIEKGVEDIRRSLERAA